MNRYAKHYPNICKLGIHDEALEHFITDLPVGRRMLLEVELGSLIERTRLEAQNELLRKQIEAERAANAELREDSNR